MTSIMSDLNRWYDEVRAAFPLPDYFDDAGEGDKFIAARLAELKPNRGRLLDIGCGPLDKTALFAKLGFSCFACDDFMDPWHRRNDTLERIIGFARASGITLHIHENGDYSIPFPEQSFDVVTILGVIEHLHQSPRDILNTAGRMLRPGGIVAIVMPNSVNLRKRISVLTGGTNYPGVRAFYQSSGTWRGHVREYTLSETRYICEASGFRVVQAVTFDSMIHARLGSSLARGAYRAISRVFPGGRDSLFVAAERPANWTPVAYSDERFREAVSESVPGGVR